MLIRFRVAFVVGVQAGPILLNANQQSYEEAFGGLSSGGDGGNDDVLAN